MQNKYKGIIFSVLLLLPAVYAETALIIHFDLKGGTVNHVFAIENNEYYRDSFEGSEDSAFLRRNNIFIQLSDANKIIFEQEADSENVGFARASIDTIKNTKRITITESGKKTAEKEINFCNNNGICEPCNDARCLSAENALLCADCGHNSDDNFCDLKKDGICDPDCVAKYYCEECQTECLFEEIETCESKDGIICNPDERCDGEIVYADDSEQCCIGLCMLKEPLAQAKRTEQAAEEEKKDANMFFDIMLYAAAMISIILALGAVFSYTAAKKSIRSRKLKNYVDTSRKKGYNDSQIRNSLASQGIKEQDLEKAMRK